MPDFRLVNGAPKLEFVKIGRNDASTFTGLCSKHKPKTARASVGVTAQIVALLQGNKRYPAEALSRHETGVVKVFFSVDRHFPTIDAEKR
jgi:outer membrane biosynthesis protein TonB